ncbi:hypothetical protein ONE63_005572 [Megalurothrips usitatus]|uniref:Small integral membrane protein 4 n=1 Tax=Megalurothrips usitatus TaxID=439358 RepID=A0AAV7XWX7_9NEOP|nr:hypothetical protein ONE63_005572 [Megalurothrips usitatus]
MSSFRSNKLARFLQNLPGFKTFGEYSILPFLFLGGAALEYVMIHWHFGEVNFYRTFKRRQAQERAQTIVENYLSKKSEEKNQ